MEGSSTIARKTWELENNILTVDPPDSASDAIFYYDDTSQSRFQQEKPWANDPHYFKRVKISALALLKMVVHARSGGTIEIMGLMQGKTDGDAIIVMDAFALPVEGTETRVNAQADAYEYMVEYSQTNKLAGRLENVVGWYHSHPGYGCWLSGIDVSTQRLNQQYQEPFLALVIDPTRTVSAGKVEIGAFRTYSEGYKPPDEPVSEYQTIPLNKIEDFGVHCKQYYSLDITYFKSSLDSHLLDLLWNKYWVNTLSSSPLLGSGDYVAGQISDLAEKLEQAESHLAHFRFGGSVSSSLHRKKELKGETVVEFEQRSNFGECYWDESQLTKITRDSSKITVEQVHGLMSQKMAQRVGGVKRAKLSPATLDFPIVLRRDGVRVHRGCSFARNCSSNRKPRLRIVSQKWKLNDIDPNAVQERFSRWVSKSQKYLSEVASPLIKKSQSVKVDLEDQHDFEDLEELLTVEQTLESDTPKGPLSFDAIISIEQFSRMNGLTGKKMQDIFQTLVPPATSANARYLVEYCCFRFLSRDSSEFNPCLKEPAFQRLIFITMLAWANPYCKERNARNDTSEKPSFQGRFVREEAFVRIAPAISGLADRATVYNLFETLAAASEQKGISLEIWLAYIQELVKIHEGRKSYQTTEFPQMSSERLLCMASNRKGPVLKWENNVAWPGKLTLTDKALYFQPVDLKGSKGILRLDLAGDKSSVEKAKVGPLGFSLFDSAVSVSSGPGLATWVLEFVDLGGELRRDVWHAIISEVIALHTFLREFGPEENDNSLLHVFGAKKGKEKAIASASNCIARLQAIQYMRNLPDDPIKLVQFSFLRQVAYGDIVCQTLAVNFWGGPLVTKVANTVYNRGKLARTSRESYESFDNASDLDGSVYLKRWMRSPSWSSSASMNFWNNSSLRQGLVLSKNLAVADLTLVERAAETCRQKYKVVKKTQATINAATIKGIPSNIDLFKELILPLSITATRFEKLRRWEEPYLTVSFLALASTIIFRNLLQYVLPVSLMLLATGMLTLKGLRRQGRLGRLFGMVTIRDQPSSNTIQKIIALKDAMQDMESYLQNVNVVLLKLRTIVLSGHPQVTTEVALVLLSVATVLVIVPFKYVLACVLFDQFTRELEFRKEMVIKFNAFLRERWEMVPAAPVLVLPFVNEESSPATQGKQAAQRTSTEK
ncbi:unnamed protein product [Thlaspi arvense]|uniref:MPN domain-containing protein n=1 Tax=Thlaspi arvense TaxID=13288 RepID=A0AAU9SKB8_THLAR|nr:unnamed protein product [Thlaspi arvense]